MASLEPPPGGARSESSTGSAEGDGDDRDSLAEILRRSVRAAPDVELVLALAVGSAACATMFAVRPWGWRTLASAGVALAAIGAWGMLDREVVERAASGRSADSLRALRALRALVGIAGWMALAALVFSIAAVAIGTWTL